MLSWIDRYYIIVAETMQTLYYSCKIEVDTVLENSTDCTMPLNLCFPLIFGFISFTHQKIDHHGNLLSLMHFTYFLYSCLLRLWLSIQDRIISR